MCCFRATIPAASWKSRVPAGPSQQVAQCRLLQRSTLTWNSSAAALYFNDKATAGAPQRLFGLALQTGHVSAVTDPPRRPLATIRRPSRPHKAVPVQTGDRRRRCADSRARAGGRDGPAHRPLRRRGRQCCMVARRKYDFRFALEERSGLDLGLSEAGRQTGLGHGCQWLYRPHVCRAKRVARDGNRRQFLGHPVSVQPRSAAAPKAPDHTGLGPAGRSAWLVSRATDAPCSLASPKEDARAPRTRAVFDATCGSLLLMRIGRRRRATSVLKSS